MNLPIDKNLQTTMSALLGFVLVVAVLAGGACYGLPPALTGTLATIVLGVCTAFTGLSAADAATIQSNMQAISDNTNLAVAALKSDMETKHAAMDAKNDAKHAENQKAIAVHEAQLAIVVPALVAAVPQIAAPVENEFKA
jgi:hypothetical protein